MRISPGILCALCIVGHGAFSAHAEGDGEAAASRPFHFVLASGGYASLGGPASYGPNLALDLLPGSFAGRFGLRGEWRGSRGYQEGTGIVGLLYEAGASRPQLAINLVAELGLSDQKEPLVGAGVSTSLWVWGPLGISSIADVHIIIDGLSSRPALNVSLALHLGH